MAVGSEAAPPSRSQPCASLPSRPTAVARLSTPGFFLSALSPFSPIQKKFCDTRPASPLRSFFSATAPSCLRNASKLGSFIGLGSLMVTGLYGLAAAAGGGPACCQRGGTAWPPGGANCPGSGDWPCANNGAAARSNTETATRTRAFIGRSPLGESNGLNLRQLRRRCDAIHQFPPAIYPAMCQAPSKSLM